jgi:hypothetical protein
MRRALAAMSVAVFCHCAAIGQQPQPFSVWGVGAARIILDVLANARVSGSLEYEGKCDLARNLIPDLPSVQQPQKPYTQNTLETFWFMFAAHPRMEVSQESNGTIRIVETGVQADILQVKIKHLSFDRISSPDQVLSVILDAPEVQSFMQTHRIQQPLDTTAVPSWKLPGVKTTPRPGVPAVSGELNDVTVADALDYILKTFPGFWLYQECESSTGERVVYFGLFPVPGRMWVWDGKTFVGDVF